MRTIRSAIITGPTGAIGTALCSCLRDKGVTVYVLVRPGSARAGHLKGLPGVEVLECDISDLRLLPEMLSGLCFDAFFHLAWVGTTGVNRDDMSLQIKNIQYTLDAVHAAAELGCKVFVGAGSQAEYGRVQNALTPDTPCFPETGYGMAKLCAGEMSRTECERLGISHIWPRILSVYGPYDGEQALLPALIRSLLQGRSLPLTPGGQQWDYLYADDAAEALFRLALQGKSGAVYPVGTGQARPLRDYLEILRDAIDPSLPLAFGERPYGEKQVMHLEADISALKRDTGFAPRTDFGTGILKTIDWIKKTYV